MNSPSKCYRWSDFHERAKKAPARIALADGNDGRVIEAAKIAEREGIAEPILIRPEKYAAGEREKFREELRRLPKFQSLSDSEIENRLDDSLYVGCLAVKRGLADGFVGGAARNTADTLRAVFSIIGLAPKTPALFGFFLLERRDCSEANPLILLGDCAVIPDPSVKQLAHIGLGAANAYEFFTGDTARIAFLSFSTQDSASHPLVDKVKEAVKVARLKAPERIIAGEWQADAALDVFSASMKGPSEHPMAGKANVLIAPDLNCGNIAYKLVQRIGHCRAVGPILWGTAQPANDLSRGCFVEDIVDMMALTTCQAQAGKSQNKGFLCPTPH